MFCAEQVGGVVRVVGIRGGELSTERQAAGLVIRCTDHHGPLAACVRVVHESTHDGDRFLVREDFARVAGWVVEAVMGEKRVRERKVSSLRFGRRFDCLLGRGYALAADVDLGTFDHEDEAMLVTR